MSEIESRLGAIVSCFGQSWLDASEPHPLRELWRRKDAIATNQLLLFGDALEAFLSTHRDWLSKKIKEIKSSDPNTRRGAMFEVSGTHMLRSQNCRVDPTPSAHPGYDAVITLPDGATLHVSIKNYGTSCHEQAFRDESFKTQAVFIDLISKQALTGVTLRALAESYPQSADWNRLRGALPDILKLWRLGSGAQVIAGFWEVVLAGSPNDVLPLSLKHLSFQVQILAPYHLNECKNLLDKLNSGTANARKHARFGPNSARGMLVRVPETISLTACVDWARAYLGENPNGPLDLVMLYQPTVVDLPNDTSSIHHAFIDLGASSFSNWARPERNMSLEVFIGMCEKRPTTRQFSGGISPQALDQIYFHQRGEFFTVFEQAADGSARADVRNLAPGVFQRAVIRMNGGGELALNGIFAPDKTFSLFD